MINPRSRRGRTYRLKAKEQSKRDTCPQCGKHGFFFGSDKTGMYRQCKECGYRKEC